MSPDKDVPLHKKKWRDLTKKEKPLMKKYLNVLEDMRRYPELSIEDVARDYGVTMEAVIKNTNAFHMEHGRWAANPDDNISRHWEFYEDGESWIEEPG